MTRHRQLIAHTLTTFALMGCSVTGCERASSTGPEPPRGGQAYVLSYDEFAATVNPILSKHGCDNLNCHGGGIRGTFALSAPGAKDDAADFEQARLQVFPPSPPESPLLMKPLAAECGGADHAGGAFFFSFDDPDYSAILTWIENGEYQ